jgi:hypothetical protein
MKKTIFICLMFISVTVMGQEKKNVWDYPVKPGMKEWNQFKSVDDMFQACQIPDDILQRISTEELLNVCLNYPALSVLLLYNSIQVGYNNFYNHFNGIRELMSRKDVGLYMLKSYMNMSLTEYNPSWIPEKRGDFSFRYMYFEILLSQPNVIRSLDLNSRKLFLEETAKKYDEKKMRNDIFGGISLSINAWVLAKSLHSIDRLPAYVKQRTSINEYLETGMSKDDKLLESLSQYAKNYENE